MSLSPQSTDAAAIDWPTGRHAHAPELSPEASCARGPRRSVPRRWLGQFKGGINRASGAGRGRLQGTRDSGLPLPASRGTGPVVMRRVPVQALAMEAAVE